MSGAGWRAGFYIGGAASFLLFIVGIWALPAGLKSSSHTSVWRRLASEIDWIGTCLASTSLAVFSYYLACDHLSLFVIQPLTNIQHTERQPGERQEGHKHCSSHP